MTTTDLTRWKFSDDKPLLLLVDEVHPWPITGNGKSSEIAVRQMLTDAVTEMDRRQAEQRAKEVGRKVDEYAAMTVLTGTITGLVFTANTAPELVGLPICASLAATAIGAVVLYRSPKAVR